MTTIGTMSQPRGSRRKRVIAKRAVPGETNRDKFVRIGKYRMNKTLHDIQLLGNLSAYEYTEEDIRKMNVTLNQVLEQVMGRFRKIAKARGEDFTF